MEGYGQGGPGTLIFVLFIIFLVLLGIFTDQFKVFFALLIVFFFGRWLYKQFTEKD